MKKELEIKDVMVGDWVDVRNDAAPNTPHLERITPSHFLRDEHWYGVELVPEILEKNEFNILRDAYGMSDPFWSYSNRSVLVDVTIIRTNNVKVIDWFNVKISTRNDIKQISFCGVKYVHQLQHALRLCGIEKEIVL